MTKNVGGIDRILRIVVGLALLVAFFVDSGASYRWWYLVGLVPLLTGLFQTCPLYSLLGVNTCPLRR